LPQKENIQRRTRELIKFDKRYRKEYGRFICGVDEAGRGPLAGPVVAAAVIFDEGVYIAGVFDSKQITYEKRDILYDKIKKKCLAFGLGIVRNIEIDKFNILNATKIAMMKAIDNLGLLPELIMVDGNFFKHKIFPVQNVIKGDALSFSIAAASIIAKVTRDRLMEKYENLFPNFSFAKHKGYPTRQHVEEIKLHGYTEIHRKSFKVKELMNTEMLFSISTKGD
jgi:ribonuclease HII